LSVQRPTSRIQFVFEPIDLLAQAITFTPVSHALPLGSVAFAPQTLILALLPFNLCDQLLARRGAPTRSHTLVMPRVDRKYKRKLRRSRRSNVESRATTR
jgi:hypothetical protein